MAMFIIIWVVFGWLSAALLLPLVVLIVAVRLYLKRHTVAQIVGGILLGTLVVLPAIWTGCLSV
jgi:membrane-associated phospholipid phosphatase